LRDGTGTFKLVDRAKTAGYQTLVVTVDVPEVGRRPRESRARATWDTLAQLRDMWPGNLVVKGVLDIEDAVALKTAGVDAVQVSSHGARQLESAPAPITVLPQMRAALGDDYPIFFDSGLRSGEDALKALTQGANFAFFGRILQFAIAARGEAGLNQLWDVLTDEMSIAMAQTGIVTLP